MHLCVIHPDGSIKHYAPATIERWYRNYKNSGFDSLIPSGREDQGIPRKLDYELQEQIKYLKTNYPRIFIMESDGTLTPIRLLNKTENAFIKREKIHLCRGEE